MHDALLVHELVAAIVNSGRDDAGFLHTCLFINRLFCEEACRLLWFACGIQDNAAHAAPQISHLAAISRQSRQRAQVYADFIHKLTFGVSDSGNEAQLHDDLACLQFPQLQEVKFSRSDAVASLNKGDTIIRYAQPNVHEFHLGEGSGLSDAFLDTLQRQCPKLRTLTLNMLLENSITKEGLSRFLASVSLKHVMIQAGFRELWSQSAFLAIEQHASLELLGLPEVQDEWIKSLTTGFLALKHVYTEISAHGLEILPQRMPYLATLHMELQSPCTTISAVARFTRLKDLALSFDDDSSFEAADLLQIAQQCPELKDIKLAEQGPCPRVAGLDDDMMDTIARHLPVIESIALKAKTAKYLTLRSIRSLGRQCPNLAMLDVSSIIIDWDEIDKLHGTGEIISTKIWSLDITLHEDQPQLPYNEGYDDNQEDSEHIAKLASSFARLFPHLEYFNLSGGGEGETQFDERVGDYIHEDMDG